MDTTILRNANVLDPASGKIRRRQDVIIENGNISSVTDHAHLTGHTNEEYDLSGKLIMPGLIDAHVHVTAVTTDLSQLARISRSLVIAQSKGILERMLARGFTSVRDAGGADAGLAAAVRLGYLSGPRLFVSGLALAQTGGHGDFREAVGQTLGCSRCRGYRSISRVVDGPLAVRVAAREELGHGADQLKVMAGGGFASGIPPERPHFTMEELRAGVEEAVAAGTYVMAHAYGPASIRRALDAGIRTIEHGNLVDAVTARAMAGKAYMVPTLGVYRGFLEHAAELDIGRAARELLERLFESGRTAIGLCQAAGVRLGFGSDLEGVLHKYQSMEFELRAGVTDPEAVIQSATTVNAEMLQMEGRLGTIDSGAIADLLVLDGNPLEDISLLLGDGQHLRAIMKGGAFYKFDV